MAHIEEGGGGRETNVELNLVPFIDLMSVCIIFLLITAVWTQVSMIQIGSSVYGKRSENQVEPPPEQEVSPFRLNVRKEGYHVRMGSETYSIPKKDGKWDDLRLLAALKSYKKSQPKASAAIISLEDDLTYENMIHGMDMLMAGGYGEISVATAEGR